MATNAAAFRNTFEYCEREYQLYSVQNGVYCVPVDNAEEERLHQQSILMGQIFGNHLILAPMQEAPDTVLECGYGQGAWAVAFAENYPDSQVNAIDIYPGDVEGPDNLSLGVCNLNEDVREWGFAPQSFDLINSRFLAPGINKGRWRTYVRDLARLLNPNGWLQMMEWGYLIQSNNGMLHENSFCRRWNDLYREALDATKDLRAGQKLEDLMQRAGLRDIRITERRIPIGSWQGGLEDVGRRNQYIISESLESLTMWTFTRERGFTQQQVENLAENCRVEMNAPGYQLYMQLYSGWGRKR